MRRPRSALQRSVVANRSLAAERVCHARMCSGRPDLHVAQATPGTNPLAPSPVMREGLARDYANMAAMIFRPIPAFDDGMSSVAELERQPNA